MAKDAENCGTRSRSFLSNSPFAICSFPVSLCVWYSVRIFAVRVLCVCCAFAVRLLCVCCAFAVRLLCVFCRVDRHTHANHFCTRKMPGKRGGSSQTRFSHRRPLSIVELCLRPSQIAVLADCQCGQ